MGNEGSLPQGATGDEFEDQARAPPSSSNPPLPQQRAGAGGRMIKTVFHRRNNNSNNNNNNNNSSQNNANPAHANAHPGSYPTPSPNGNEFVAGRPNGDDTNMMAAVSSDQQYYAQQQQQQQQQQMYPNPHGGPHVPQQQQQQQQQQPMPPHNQYYAQQQQQQQQQQHPNAQYIQHQDPQQQQQQQQVVGIYNTAQPPPKKNQKPGRGAAIINSMRNLSLGTAISRASPKNNNAGTNNINNIKSSVNDWETRWDDDEDDSEGEEDEKPPAANNTLPLQLRPGMDNFASTPTKLPDLQYNHQQSQSQPQPQKAHLVTATPEDQRQQQTQQQQLPSSQADADDGVEWDSGAMLGAGDPHEKPNVQMFLPLLRVLGKGSFGKVRRFIAYAFYASQIMTATQPHVQHGSNSYIFLIHFFAIFLPPTRLSWSRNESAKNVAHCLP
jgi:hypothetical protein